MISVHYDPMIAKVIASGSSRREALKRLSQALGQFRVVGVRTNIDFIQRILGLADFHKGAVDTSFIQEHHQSLFEKRPVSDQDRAMAALFMLKDSCSQPTDTCTLTSRSA